MRRTLSILTLFFILTGLHGQTKTFYIPDRVTNRKDWNFILWEKQRSIDYNITQLLTDTTFDHFYRLTNSRQIIEVWLKDNIFSGQIINYTKTYVSSEDTQKKKSELIYNKIGLSSDTAKIIFYKFKSLDNIPDMEKIKGWGIGFDGETYSIESSSKENYYLKSYWTPTAQDDTVAYTKDIINFCDFIYKDFNLYRHYEEFTNTLPNGNYTDGFVNMTIGKRKKMKKKQ